MGIRIFSLSVETISILWESWAFRFFLLGVPIFKGSRKATSSCIFYFSLMAHVKHFSFASPSWARTYFWSS